MTRHGWSLTSLLAWTAAFAACDGGDPPRGAGAGDDDAARAARIEALPSPAAAGSGEPHLFAADDRVYLSWIEPAGPDREAHALRFAVWDGAAWTEPRTIASGADWFVNWADFPSLVRLPDGRLAAHWLERSGAETYAYGIRIVMSEDEGRTWSEPIVPHRDGTPTEHGFVSLFAAAGNRLGAVWLDGRKFAAADREDAAGERPGADEMTLRAATIGRDGGLEDEALLDERACDCCQTGAAVGSAGPIVAYRDRSAAEVRDIAVVRFEEGRWTAPRDVHADGWEIAACPVNGPAIAADGDLVAVAWFTAASDSARVLVAFSQNGGRTFGPPARVDGGQPAGRVDVALLPDGSALVVWLEQSGGEASVRARRVGSERTSGAAPSGQAVAVATTSEERASGFPQMALLGDRALFAWTDPGEPSRVRVASAPLAAFR